MSYSVWDKEKLESLTNTEKFILKESCLPKYQWIENLLVPDNCDKSAYKRLTDIRENITEFVNSSVNNLVICGNNLGNGKTSWAIKLLLTYIESNKDKLEFVDANKINTDNFDYCVICQSVPFLVEMKQFGNNADTYKLFSRLCRTRLAVIDDLGAVPMSQYDYNIFYAIIEERLIAGLPTILTMNFSNVDDLKKEIGPRLAERIWTNSEIVELKGRGYRGA